MGAQLSVPESRTGRHVPPSHITHHTSLMPHRSVQAHTQSLVQWLYDRLAPLRHSNGTPVLAIFGKHGELDREKVWGGNVWSLQR